MKITSYYPVLCVKEIDKVAKFYKKYFHFQTIFESDWYVHLQMEQNQDINLALVCFNHESIPKPYQHQTQGTLLNFEMDDIDDLYAELKNQKLTMLLDLRDEPWGQRHFIVCDPSGTMVDVIKPIEPSDEFKSQYFQTP